MLDIHQRILPLEDRRRAERIEPLDEMEEWRLIQVDFLSIQNNFRIQVEFNLRSFFFFFRFVSETLYVRFG